jgi:hypothetical protein
MMSAIKDGWANPYTEGAAWEGTFTVPVRSCPSLRSLASLTVHFIQVCDVSWVTQQQYLRQKQFILQPYASNSRPKWCGPVCTGSHDVTTAFLAAAHMDSFKNPTQGCDADTGPTPTCNKGQKGAANNAIGAAIQSIDTSAVFGFGLNSSGYGYTAESACKNSTSSMNVYCCVAGSGTDSDRNVAYVTYTMADGGGCDGDVTSNGTEVAAIAHTIQDFCKSGPPNDNSGSLKIGCAAVGVSGSPCDEFTI